MCIRDSTIAAGSNWNPQWHILDIFGAPTRSIVKAKKEKQREEAKVAAAEADQTQQSNQQPTRTGDNNKDMNTPPHPQEEEDHVSGTPQHTTVTTNERTDATERR